MLAPRPPEPEPVSEDQLLTPVKVVELPPAPPKERRTRPPRKRRRAQFAGKRTPNARPEAPAPNRTPKPSETPSPEAPPVFGISMDSVVTGEASVVAPVGNTLGAGAMGEPVQALGAGGATFAPVDGDFIGRFPQGEIGRMKPRYPSKAKQLGQEGVVTLRLGIDRTGRLRKVGLLESGGAGFDSRFSRGAPSYIQEDIPAALHDNRRTGHRLRNPL